MVAKRATFHALFGAAVRESRWRTAAEVIVALIPALIAAGRAVFQAAVWEVLVWMMLFVVLVGVFVYEHALMVWRNEAVYRAQLERQLAERDAARATVRIVYRPVFPMWWAEQSWIRIGVRNENVTARARDVEVKLMTMTPNRLPLNVLPAKLGWKDDTSAGRDECAINPGQTEYFDLVRAGVSNNPGLMRLWTVVQTGQEFVLSEHSDWSCDLELSVSAENANPSSARFRLTRRALDAPTLTALE
jgi:hypothetical protein